MPCAATYLTLSAPGSGFPCFLIPCSLQKVLFPVWSHTWDQPCLHLCSVSLAVFAFTVACEWCFIHWLLPCLLHACWLDHKLCYWWLVLPTLLIILSYNKSGTSRCLVNIVERVVMFLIRWSGLDFWYKDQMKWEIPFCPEEEWLVFRTDRKQLWHWKVTTRKLPQWKGV